MIQLSASSQLLIATSAQDFRKGIDGFASLCRHEFNRNPQDSTIFVFINRSKTMIRLLAYDHKGYWLMTKRLSKGKFKHWPKAAQPIAPLLAKELKLLLRNEAFHSIAPLNN
jgi:hypothetical protein